jgi:hypothetical protein
MGPYRRPTASCTLQFADWSNSFAVFAADRQCHTDPIFGGDGSLACRDRHSFGLFAPYNGTVIATLSLCVLSV